MNVDRIYGGLKNSSVGYRDNWGAILMLHSVGTNKPRFRIPMNADLEISAEFLDTLISHLKKQGYNFVSLDQIYDLIHSGQKLDKHIAITLDDGYRDNLDNAYPIFKKHQVPFCIYVATQFPDQTANLWWLMLEQVVQNNTAIAFDYKGTAYAYRLESLESKEKAWSEMRGLFIAASARDKNLLIDKILHKNGVVAKSFNEEFCLSWEQIRELSEDPLCTIGAHSVNHPSLAHISAQEMSAEMSESKRLIEEKLAKKVHHFCYPYGSPENCGSREFEMAHRHGFRTATTTTIAPMSVGNTKDLCALPRIPVRGRYQSAEFTQLLIEGIESSGLFVIEDHLQFLLGSSAPSVTSQFKRSLKSRIKGRLLRLLDL
jgi:peptidoglycan/xylan/chitin deacetylase (PgdA/CDA1 family)